MPTWNPSQYLRFQAERTQPCRDLAARVPLDSPARIIDLGCGPGNSTQILLERWPHAEITGLDNSPDMIDQARRASDACRWMAAEIAEWAAGTDQYDLVFSNAALQWLPDHRRLFPGLMTHVRKGGALAVQMPGNWDAAAHRLMRGVASRWRETDSVREWFTHDVGFYYDLLAPLAARIDLWATEYIHIMDGPADIVEWYKGTGMRPFLDALPGAADRESFLASYLDAIREAYPPHENGGVLFPFRRIFLVAAV
jgi:trans-aconitate 2-methyltransferase